MAEETRRRVLPVRGRDVAGKTTPLHRHPEADETIYVLEGEIVVHVDGREVESAPAACPSCRGASATPCSCVSERPRLLTLQTPGIGQEFYRGASEPRPTTPSDTVDIARVQASAQANLRHRTPRTAPVPDARLTVIGDR